MWRSKEDEMKDRMNSGSEALALPRAAAARAICVSVKTLDRLIQAGAIRTVPAFRRRLVPMQELQRFISEGGHQ